MKNIILFSYFVKNLKPIMHLYKIWLKNYLRQQKYFFPFFPFQNGIKMEWKDLEF